MKRCLILVTSFMLLLGASAFAQTSDLWVQFGDGGTFNSDADSVYIGESNILGIYLASSLPIQGTSLPFVFANSATGTWDFDGTYGNFGGFPGANYVLEEPAGPVAGVWNTAVPTYTNMPNNMALGTAKNFAPFIPASATPILWWSMKLDMASDNVDTPGGFSVHLEQWGLALIEIDLSTGPGTTTASVPSFNGQPGSAIDGSDTQPALFDVVTRQCVPPVFTSTPSASENKNHCMSFSFDFDADPDPAPGNQPPATIGAFSATVGNINAATGEYTLAGPSDCAGPTDVTVSVTNSCAGSADYSFQVNWTNNAPTITNCPGPIQVGKGNAVDRDLNATDADPCDALTWSVVANDAVVNAPTIDGTGNFHWLSDISEGGLDKHFTVTVTDPCGGTATCDITITVLNTQPFVIKIQKTHQTIQGNYEYVSVTKEFGSELMGGYDFLIGYDASALSFISASLGADVGPGGLGWEYFTYRYGAFGNCGGPCPSGKLRIVAIADANNGPNHPSGFAVPDGGELASLKFYVTNDRTFECQKIGINFCWVDCGDNGISSVTGDTLFISSQVFDYQNTDPINDQSHEITDLTCRPFSMGGACADCDVSAKYQPVRFILFWNGGIDIACADSIDDRGDLNLNKVAYEIADAVLYTNYFLYGPSALDPLYYDAQVAASDVNADGNPLSVGDLVYLLRVVVGDALPFPKLAPFANTANVTLANGTLSTNANVDLGAVYATFEVNGSYNVVSNTDMEVLSAESDGLLKVLVYSGTSNMSNAIDAGASDLFTVNGNVNLVDVEVADYQGNMLNTKVSKSVLPTSFALHQNVPNPFNPTTKIGLDLPTASDWSISIYNVAGQLVQSFNGNGVGTVSVEWDASNVASGIYFYRATVNDWTQTKKMVLMK